MGAAERIDWIDMAKGYGVLLVILGHLNTTLIQYEIFTFHMPLFFFLSGYVFKPDKYGFDIFIKNKMRTLILPYFFMGTIIMVCMWISHGKLSLEDFIQCALRLLIQNRFQTIWFLACLFFTELLAWGLFRFCKGNKFRMLVVSGFIGVAGLLYYHFGGVSLFWNIDISMTAIFYFALGFWVNDMREDKKWKTFVNHNATLTIAIMLHCVCSIGNYFLCGERFDMFYCQYGVVPVMLIATLTGIYIIYRISVYWNIKCILYLGRHSMIYFGLHHALPIPLLEIIYFRFGIFQNPVRMELVIYLVISMAAILISMTALDFMVRHTRLRFFLGIKKV